MAVLHALPGLEVTVTVDAGKNCQPCREYIDTNDDAEPQEDFTSISYIESYPRATFSLNIDLDPEFLQHTHFTMGATVWVDGHISIGSAEDTDKNGNQVKRRFGFARMEVDDDEDLWVPDKLVEQVKNIGEITVAFYRKQRMQQNRTFDPRKGSSVRRLSNLENLDVIPEKALKGRAVSHRASFGKERVHPYSRKRNAPMYKWVDNEKRPYASFKFRYRSWRDLQSQMIVPWSPSPLSGNYVSNDGTNWATHQQKYTDQQVKEESPPRETRSGNWTARPVPSRTLEQLEDGEIVDTEDDEVVFLSTRSKQGPMFSFAPVSRVPELPALPVYALNNIMDQPIVRDDRIAMYGEEPVANDEDEDEDDIQFVFEREIPQLEEPRSESLDLIDLGGWD